MRGGARTATTITRMVAGQRGYVLIELAVAAMLITLGAVWMSSRLSDEALDARAQATASLMLTTRGAVQTLLVQHGDTLTGYPPLQDAQPMPAYLSGPLPLAFEASELAAPVGPGRPGYLTGATGKPPLGEALTVRIWREGDCPGHDCRLQAIVHTTGPLRASAAHDYDPALVGQVMLATEGYGGHSPSGDPGRLRGAVFDVENPLGDVAGIVAVSASLDATLFNQFVRHGDTRPVRLRDRLEVEGEIATAAGLALDTAVAAGTGCPREGLYARTNDGTLALCTTGIWFEIDRYVVTAQRTGLRDGDALAAPACPAGVQPFTRLGLESADISITGNAIQLHGTTAGSISGSGAVNQSGAVTLSGSFQGSITNHASSRIRATQTVALVAGRVQIQGGDAGARAYAVQGCTRGRA